MASNAVSFLQEQLRSQGLFLRSGDDFAEFSGSLRGIDRSLTEHFSVQYQTIMPPQGFWLMLTDEWGIPVGTVAARLDDLGPTSLAEFWKIYLPRTYTAEDGKPVELKERQPSFCQEAREGSSILAKCGWRNAIATGASPPVWRNSSRSRLSSGIRR